MSVAAQDAGGIVEQTLSSYPSDLTPSNGILFFAADDGHTGQQLWRSDGTAEGTVLVKAVRPDVTNGLAVIENLTDVNGVLFFTVDVTRPVAAPARTRHALSVPGRGFSREDVEPFSQTVDLWRSDGTAAGTVLLHHFEPPAAYTATAPVLMAVEQTLFLVVDDGVHGRELWKSDGTDTGTVLIKDIRPGPQDGVISAGAGELLSANGVLFFDGDDGSGGQGLWKSDGTAAGTVLVEPFVQPVGGPYSFAATNGALYFAANDYDTREFQLWRSNGTPGGTSLVQSIAAGVNSSGLGQLTAAGDTLFFVVADNGEPGGGLWRSDGTAAGTTLVRHFDIAPGGGLWPGGPVAVGGTLFFAANCGYSIGTYLWKSDGNPSGTVLVSCNMDNGGYTANLTAFGRGTVFYTSGSGLWRSDGTSNGTAPVRLFAASPADLQPMNDTLFFTADDGHTGYELWKTDGTEAGTMLVQDINTAPTVVPCVGDCDAAGGVTVGEILTMVDIALGGAQPSACPNGIPSGSEVNVALILQAVNNALNGCGG